MQFFSRPTQGRDRDVMCGRFDQKCTTWNLFFHFILVLTTVSSVTLTNASRTQPTPYESVGIWTARRRSSTSGLYSTESAVTPPTITTTTARWATTAALTGSAKNYSTQQSSDPLSMGHWLNLGIPYYKCPSPFEKDHCKNLPSSSSLPENSAMWKPDYASLMERITCVIQKLNCPTDNRSFQVSSFVSPNFSVIKQSIVLRKGEIT